MPMVSVAVARIMGGVSRCDRNQGRQVCGDGGYSPSCGCEKNPMASGKPVKKGKLSIKGDRHK